MGKSPPLPNPIWRRYLGCGRSHSDKSRFRNKSNHQRNPPIILLRLCLKKNKRFLPRAEGKKFLLLKPSPFGIGERRRRRRILSSFVKFFPPNLGLNNGELSIGFEAEPSMDQNTVQPAPVTTTIATTDGCGSTVDPFLVEALQNPRHRLTILRMELDIQKFMQNAEQQQFEFQHFPTSYLRLAAHRVAQHYGLQTTVHDNFLDGQGTRILVRKLAESKFPPLCLSDIPTKLSENDKRENVKIVLRPKPKASSDGNSELGMKPNSVRTVEERKEEYDRARARIFSSPGSPELEDAPLRSPSDGKSLCFGGDEIEGSRSFTTDSERNLSRDGSTSRVAILRDREKDRTDPDYDRSYERYVRNLPVNQGFSLVPVNMPKFQPPCMQYDSVLPHAGQLPSSQASVGYRNPTMNPYAVMGLNRASRDAVYVQWPSHSMMYAQSYDQFRHAVFQAPICQQPLSFDYLQNH